MMGKVSYNTYFKSTKKKKGQRNNQKKIESINIVYDDQV